MARLPPKPFKVEYRTRSRRLALEQPRHMDDIPERDVRDDVDDEFEAAMRAADSVFGSRSPTLAKAQEVSAETMRRSVQMSEAEKLEIPSFLLRSRPKIEEPDTAPPEEEMEIEVEAARRIVEPEAPAPRVLPDLTQEVVEPPKVKPKKKPKKKPEQQAALFDDAPEEAVDPLIPHLAAMAAGEYETEVPEPVQDVWPDDLDVAARRTDPEIEDPVEEATEEAEEPAEIEPEVLVDHEPEPEPEPELKVMAEEPEAVTSSSRRQYPARRLYNEWNRKALVKASKGVPDEKAAIILRPGEHWKKRQNRRLW
jgi:pilus assembly protein FimV